MLICHDYLPSDFHVVFLRAGCQLPPDHIVHNGLNMYFIFKNLLLLPYLLVQILIYIVLRVTLCAAPDKLSHVSFYVPQSQVS